MSLIRSTRYPGRFTAPTTAQPLGAFQNRSTPVTLDGSYLEKDWANDWDALFGSLLSGAGVTPNGTVDAVGNSQYYDALLHHLQTSPSAFAVDTGSANTYVAAYVPAVTALTDGLLRFKVNITNTGASTFAPNAVTAKAIVGLAGIPLQGGELIAGGTATVLGVTALNAYVLLSCTGASLQVGTGTQTQHAVTVGQVKILGAPTYANSNTTLIPGTWLVDTSAGSFTLTLPLNPTKGMVITLIDASATWGTNNFTLARNGKTIMTQSADLTINVSDQQFSIWYNGSDWRLV